MHGTFPTTCPWTLAKPNEHWQSFQTHVAWCKSSNKMISKYFLAAFVVFSSAFLLFQIQPMIARVILPLHGGTASVWTTCMMFFQLVLLAGYAWAHYCQTVLRRFGLHLQLVLLMGGLVCSVLLLPGASRLIATPPSDLPGGMTVQILQTLSIYVGVPFFLLASTGPTIQSWIAANYSNEQTYRLYAYSNVGSILGLLTYPFVFERFFGVSQQLKIWAAGCIIFAIAITTLAFVLKLPFKSLAEKTLDGSENGPGPELAKASLNLGSTFSWIGLAAIASTVFLATTNYLCQEVASTPLLWVVPLSLYLLSFVICFDSPRWYIPQLWSGLFAVSAIGSVLLVHLGSYAGFGLQTIIYSLACFSGCMICHGELARRRPDSSNLTWFYLAISVGGALAGIFVSIAAPHVFDGFYEFQISLLFVAAVAIPNIIRTLFNREQTLANRMIGGAVSIGLLLSILGSVWSLRAELGIANQANILFRGRNEYGLTQVKQNDCVREFISGRTVHGTQSSSPKFELSHSGYYQQGSGVQIAFEGMRCIDDDQKLNVAVLGLGAGAMATWFNENDKADFYEINPMVVDVANNYFSFLAKSKGKKQLVVGDGRIEMLRRNSNPNKDNYDLIFMDAFASDSIPVHLLTDEAIDIYLENLTNKGVVIFHITNHFVDLLPVLMGHVDRKQLNSCYIVNQTDSNSRSASNSSGTRWLILGRGDSFFSTEVVTKSSAPLPNQQVVHWTDDHASIVGQINWNANINWQAIKSATAASKDKNRPTESK
jgi:hypothetical protein